MTQALLGCDVGGTFTDAFLLDVSSQRRWAAKAPSTPEDLTGGILAACQRVLDRAGAGPGDVEQFIHGTTTATNALLEDDLARTALVTNRGFEDVIEIGRQARPSLYDLSVTGPPPLVPRDLRFGLAGRLDARGRELEPLDTGEIDALGDTLERAGVQAVAVGLLHAHVDGRHEASVAERLREHLGGDIPVVTSHEVSPEVREVERFTTTIVNAGLQSRMADYLARLTDRLDTAGIQAPVRVLDSAGAVLRPGEAARLPVRTIVSGPAGGVAACVRLAARMDNSSLLGVDMGGTSTDVSLVLEGEPTQRWETEIAGRRLLVPAADIDTVGAGGGSIAWLDDAGGLRVGPRSAGADPGPACYGRGGVEPTLTDAHLVLGRIPGDRALGGSIEPRPEEAETALDGLADRAGTTVEALARGIVRVASAHAVRGIRRLTARHGVDPATLSLVAFGGAGPLMAAGWAVELSIDRVLVPRNAGMASAEGLLAAPPQVERAGSLLARLDELDRADLVERYGQLDEEAREGLGSKRSEIEHLASARYVGQSHELTVPVPEDDPARLREAFDQAHREHHGYALEHTPVEVVTLRSRARQPPALGPSDPSPPPASKPAPTLGSTRTWFEHGPDTPVETSVLDVDDLEPGHRLEGPALGVSEGATIVVPPGWDGRADATGTLVLTREGGP